MIFLLTNKKIEILFYLLVKDNYLSTLQAFKRNLNNVIQN